MGSPKSHPNELKFSVTLMLIISLTFPHNSVVAEERKGVKQKNSKLVLGSRPPGCFNKCFSCKPCMAALVISPHHRDNHNGDRAASAQRDESYYLLSWKCKRANKFFQP